jgi:Uncharacterized protein containing LysM domain
MQIWMLQEFNFLRLPVLPSSIEIGNSMQNTTVNITELGEVNLIGKRGLRTLSISSFFPRQNYSFAQYSDFPIPEECVRRIRSWMDNPIHVVITGVAIMSMTIENFTYSKQDSSGDIHYTLELKEYKNPTLKTTYNIPVNKAGKKIHSVAGKRETKKVKSTIYIVKSGDTLASIAKKLTGSASNYKAIANQNNISNPNKIKVGQKLVIQV